MKAFTTGPFTGKHITIILVIFFAVVIAVNLTMARLASSTFGGVVVDNSYVAGQKFNGWLKEADRERALGWKAEARHQADGKVAVKLTGAQGSGLVLKADAWHPLGRLPDQPLTFQRQLDGTFVSNEVLPKARWRLRLDAQIGEKRWRAEQELQ